MLSLAARACDSTLRSVVAMAAVELVGTEPFHVAAWCHGPRTELACVVQLEGGRLGPSDCVGEAVGDTEGAHVGAWVGESLGAGVGGDDGEAVGDDVGAHVTVALVLDGTGGGGVDQADPPASKQPCTHPICTPCMMCRQGAGGHLCRWRTDPVSPLAKYRLCWWHLCSAWQRGHATPL